MEHFLLHTALHYKVERQSSHTAAGNCVYIFYYYNTSRPIIDKTKAFQYIWHLVVLGYQL